MPFRLDTDAHVATTACSVDDAPGARPCSLLLEHAPDLESTPAARSERQSTSVRRHEAVAPACGHRADSSSLARRACAALATEPPRGNQIRFVAADAAVRIRTVPPRTRCAPDHPSP